MTSVKMSIITTYNIIWKGVSGFTESYFICLLYTQCV